VAVAQLVHRAAVRRAVERDRELQLVGAHAQRRAGERDPLRVAGELELGLVGRSVAKSMSRSLRMNTRPPSTRPCTRPAICRISLLPRCVRVSTLRPRSTTLVKRVSSMTTGVEPAHVERALAGGGHRQHVRARLAPSRNGRMTRIGSPPW
jgi:hypothetical protein